ncbi:hypothetical protein Trydic_g22130 [Trypoxylus dichotomus]
MIFPPQPSDLSPVEFIKDELEHNIEALNPKGVPIKWENYEVSVKDEPRFGKPNEVDADEIKAIIDSDRHILSESLRKG